MKVRPDSLPVEPLRWEPPPSEATLPAGEVHLFAFSLDLPASAVEGLERTLSSDEVARANGLKLGKGRRRLVVGRGLTRTILGGYLKREASHVSFSYGANGKPGLAGCEAEASLRFNFSASDDLGMLAVQWDRSLGVDIEAVRPLPNALPIARRRFAHGEAAALSALGQAELQSAFFSLWTRREAVVKCLGAGLSHSVDSFSLAPVPSGSRERVPVGTADGGAVLWVLSLPPPREGYVAAMATEGEPASVRSFIWAGSR